MGVKDQSKKDKTGEKYIGWYCNGSDISECKKYFGQNLELICKTCPQ